MLRYALLSLTLAFSRRMFKVPFSNFHEIISIRYTGNFLLKCPKMIIVPQKVGTRSHSGINMDIAKGVIKFSSF